MADLRGPLCMLQARRKCGRPVTVGFDGHFYYLYVISAFLGLGVGS